MTWTRDNARTNEYARSKPPQAPALTLEAPALPPGSDPRPPGRGWLLVDYSWHEKTGVGRLVYRRRWNPKERVVVSVHQPAPHTDKWAMRPPIDHDTVLGRYFEALRVTTAMQEVGAYGR